MNYVKLCLTMLTVFRPLLLRIIWVTDIHAERGSAFQGCLGWSSIVLPLARGAPDSQFRELCGPHPFSPLFSCPLNHSSRCFLHLSRVLPFPLLCQGPILVNSTSSEFFQLMYSDNCFVLFFNNNFLINHRHSLSSYYSNEYYPKG